MPDSACVLHNSGLKVCISEFQTLAMTNPAKCFLCSAECEDTCQTCTLSFCSSSHLRVHKQTGKCSPWMVETRPGVGRVVVAVRDIQPFELVMRDTDLLGMVMVDAKACVMCGEMKDLRKCVCGFVRCNTGCFESKHIDECSELKRINTKSKTLKDKTRLVTCLGFWRMIKLKQQDPEKWENLMKLVSHVEKRKKSKQFRKSVKHLVKNLNLLNADGTNEVLLSRLQGILETNSHSFNKSIHHIFNIFSIISHSCIPNCEHLLTGKQAIVRAKMLVRKGEEITIRYSELCLHREILQEEIAASWLFRCCCPRCSDSSELGTEASSFKCEWCKGGFVREYEENMITCNNCEKVMTHKEYIDKAESLRKLEINCKARDDIPALIEKMEKLGGHPMYHSVIQLKIRFLESSIGSMDTKFLPLFLEYSQDVNRFMDALNPGISRLRGRLMSCSRKAAASRNEDTVNGNREDSGKNRLIEQKMMSGYFKC